MQPEPLNETAIDHGTPGEPHHWRTFYAKWLTDGDEVGVTPQDVIDQIILQLPTESPAVEYLNYAKAILNGEAEAPDADDEPAVDDAGLPPQAWSQPDTRTGQGSIEFAQEIQAG